jgi:hypothetical protein
MSADLEMLEQIENTKDFFKGVFLEDSLADWNLACAFAQYIIRLRPEECGGHLILARALRHLGDLERARAELQLSKDLLPNDPLASDYQPQIEKEDRLYRSIDRGEDEPDSPR